MEPSELNEGQETTPIMVAVFDHGECRLGTAVEYDAALTLWATLSEDPANWDEMVGYWARYRRPSACGFADGLPNETHGERETANALHALTVAVHRDWLMTPREELNGRCPRDLLHGARDWSDAIVWGQRQRFEDSAPMTAAPDDVVGFADAPMGSEEKVIYFDLCREVIDSATSNYRSG